MLAMGQQSFNKFKQLLENRPDETDYGKSRHEDLAVQHVATRLVVSLKFIAIPCFQF